MTSILTVLGAYGTKSQKGGSSAFLVDKKNAIDAGNLIAPLGGKCIELEAVWLTHSHLDHIVDIAFIVDNYYERREKTLNIYALPETIEALQKHIFNHTIWPDFSTIPLANGTGMSLTYHPIEPGERYKISEQLSVEPLVTDHTVPSCGYVIHKDGNAILMTADTLSLEATITRLQKCEEIGSLIVECSFPSSMETLAIKSKHLTPKLLFTALETLEKEGLEIYINHIKPEYEKEIVKEIEALKGKWSVTILKEGDLV